MSDTPVKYPPMHLKLVWENDRWAVIDVDSGRKLPMKQFSLVDGADGLFIDCRLAISEIEERFLQKLAAHFELSLDNDEIPPRPGFDLYVRKIR